MASIPEHRLFDALATLSRAFADGALPGGEPGDPAPAIAAMDDEAREVLGDAALAIAYGAFASRGTDGGVMPMMLATLGLLAVAAGEEPDPPAEILGIGAEDARVEAEIDRAGDAVDAEFGREADPAAVAAALEARIIGTAITLSGCSLPDGAAGQGAVRLGAARLLVRLAAGLVALEAAGDAGGRAPPRGA
jgi:hypothetical protein